MVFMIEKAVMVIIYMYATSFSLLGAQYVIGDVYGFTLTSPVTGQVIKSNLLTIVNINNINTISANATSISRTQTVTNPITTAAGAAWDLLQLITGTYIFNILYLLGVPAIFIAGLVVIYSILLIRAIVGYLRGI